MTFGEAVAVIRQRDGHARRILPALRAAAQLEARAREAQRPEIYAQAHATRLELAALWTQYNGILTQLERYLAYIPGVGLGAVPIVVPVAIAAAVVAGAVALSAIFRKASAAESVVRALTSGLLSPAEATALLGELPPAPAGLGQGLGQLGKGLLVLALVGGAYMAATRAKGSRRWE